MKDVAILTDFINHDPAYSLCAVVANQAKMIAGGGYACRVLVRPGFDHVYEGAEVVVLDPGKTGSNIVEVDDGSADEIAHLTNQMRDALDGVDVVLTHDMIYQPNMWKYHVAARRLAKERPGLAWLHWVHSATNMGVPDQTGEFKYELEGQFPNARLVVMHVEEKMRKIAAFGYQPHQAVVIPNPIDFTEGYHPLALEAIEAGGLWQADVIAVYPCRLDRGKQPHLIVEIFAELAAMEADARVVIVDFHSTGGDKKKYRDEMRRMGKQKGVPVLFTSQLEGDPEAHYHIPHRAVMDLMEFGDVLVHPSMSESDPLIVPEAAWKRCGLALNYDLPLFHLWQGDALLYKFSSCIDIATGMPGETKTKYGERDAYMRHVAGGIAYLMSHNPVLKLHAKMRRTRSLNAVWTNNLWPAIEAA